MKRPFMVWIGFISICCSKVALGCWYYKELLKTLKVAPKLPSTISLCLVVGNLRVCSGDSSRHHVTWQLLLREIGYKFVECVTLH